MNVIKYKKLQFKTVEKFPKWANINNCKIVKKINRELEKDTPLAMKDKKYLMFKKNRILYFDVFTTITIRYEEENTFYVPKGKYKVLILK